VRRARHTAEARLFTQHGRMVALDGKLRAIMQQFVAVQERQGRAFVPRRLAMVMELQSGIKDVAAKATLYDAAVNRLREVRDCTL
jgi:hypothetical protein